MMNPRQKKIATICCIGCVILTWRIYVIVTKYMPAPANASQAQGSVDGVPGGPNGVRASSSNWIEIPAHAQTAQDTVARQAWGRDPFAIAPGQIKPKLFTTGAASLKPEKLPQAVKFNGVSRTGDRWLAAINGSIYRVGDHLDEDFQIVAIDRNSVSLGSNGWVFEYSLGSQKPNVRRMGENP
jgi:hypothetical protein